MTDVFDDGCVDEGLIGILAVECVNKRLMAVEDLECIDIGDGDCMRILDLDGKGWNDEGEDVEIEVGDKNDENRKDVVVKNDNLEDQEDVAALEMVGVLLLLAAMSRRR